MRSSSMFALCVAVAVATVAGAQEGDVGGAREHYRKATKAFELGAFDEAIREYAEAYRLRDDPAFLYNLGQAHRLGEHPAEALHFYKMYLTKVPEAANRAEVEAKIEALQTLVDQQRKARAMQPDQVRPMQAVPEAVAAPPKLREPPPPGRTKKISGIVVGTLGVALVATGSAFAALAKKSGDDLTALNDAHKKFAPNLESDGKRDQIIAGVTLGLGGAAVATGVVLYVLGHREARAAGRGHDISFVPLVGPGRVAATVDWRF
jgi:tetratricopeptide (TPR) repeat protein